MEKDKVPQDDANILEGKYKVIKYATDEKGNFVPVSTVGWEPENIVLTQAWEDINEKVDAARIKVENGELSPIAYYMEKQMMDVKMLAEYTGFWKFTVKRHLKPSAFKKLSEEKLQKYACAFRITVGELKNIK